MRKNTLRILLDGAILLLLVLLYDSHAIGLSFHEIAGLAIFALFAVHCALNRAWIARVTRRFLRRDLSGRIKLRYVLVALLLASFLAVLISGVLISQVVFRMPEVKGSPWRTIHHFAAALTVILAGVHLGLNWSFVSSRFRKFLRIPRLVARPLAIVCVIAVVGFGVYGLATSGFTTWLSGPLVAQAGQGTGTADPQTTVSSPNTQDGATSGSGKESADSGTHAAKGGENKNTTQGESLTPKPGEAAVTPDGHLKGKAGEGSVGAVGRTMATLLCMVGVFAVAAYYPDRHLARRRTAAQCRPGCGRLLSPSRCGQGLVLPRVNASSRRFEPAHG